MGTLRAHYGDFENLFIALSSIYFIITLNLVVKIS